MHVGCVGPGSRFYRICSSVKAGDDMEERNMNKIITAIGQIILLVEATALAFLMAAWIRDRRDRDG